ncbi:MAG: hypothetical protein COB78_03480 [Hyphomicrobiales bacterium]|nr:MAG: hypothetical protein COB78_03480 [Hyphomicrobiales bacterium]
MQLAILALIDESASCKGTIPFRHVQPFTFHRLNMRLIRPNYLGNILRIRQYLPYGEVIRIVKIAV